MAHPLLANLLFETVGGRTVLHAMPLLLGALCVLAVAYRYYSAFLAAKVAALDDSRKTPAHRYYDGQNYDPTNKWVLFGHHFAAIAGAGPLIGPVLAIQYGYMPGLLWLVVGVCLAGAVQDMLVLAASVRRGGKSLAEIARTELGRPAAVIVAAGARELVPGSSWGTFTIACTIPIALFMGLWMYRVRKGRIGEASVIGAAAVLAAVVVGNWVPGSPLERFFSLSKDQTVLALTV